MRLAKRFERGREPGRREFGLFPRGEASAFGDPVVVSQFRREFLCQALRGCINLIGKGADGSRDRDTLRGEEGKLNFPVEPNGRDRRIREPVEEDVAVA